MPLSGLVFQTTEVVRVSINGWSPGVAIATLDLQTFGYTFKSQCWVLDSVMMSSVAIPCDIGLGTGGQATPAVRPHLADPSASG